MQNRFAQALLFSVLTITGAAPAATPPPAATTIETRRAQLVDDFVSALDQVASGQAGRINSPGIQFWIDGLAQHDIDPAFLARRLGKVRNRTRLRNGGSTDAFAAFRQLRIEHLPPTRANRDGVPFALHAVKFDVEEDYDDTTNDDIYCYFITTHDDQVWGKASSIYRGMDEGDSFFFLPLDRGLFGPKGDKIVPLNHTIVDFGIVESDGDDITQIQALSGAIVDLAVKALDIYNPQAGAAAEQARAEVKNLLNLIVAMDDDDHLVTDTLYFTPDSMMSQVGPATFNEFDRSYDRETAFTHFAYRIHFRLMR
jgi:hypothetical protein